MAIAAGGILLPLISALGMALLAFLILLSIQLYQFWQPFAVELEIERFTLDSY